jgi:GrpB-like predicted nucleotidyltransferase (UPF0157 family)
VTTNDDTKRAEEKEAKLIAVTVGERKPLNGPVLLSDYDARWPDVFTRHERQIRATLGSSALLVEHVGSTSVPLLSAKPIIDIILGVANSANEQDYVQPLESQGYVLRIREPDWFEHRLLKVPNVNLHVFSKGCEEIVRMLQFRDWLRTHEDDRLYYQTSKQQLASRTWRYTQDYADAKTQVIQQIMSRATNADK